MIFNKFLKYYKLTVVYVRMTFKKHTIEELIEIQFENTIYRLPYTAFALRIVTSKFNVTLW